VKTGKAMGLFGGLVMSVGLLAFTPAVASAAGSYSYDGGSPASCPGSYSVWGSNTFYNPSGATGYVKVEMVYCPAWQVVWTRAYNYTSRSSVLLATGIERVSSDTAHNKQYDYVKTTCDSFCLDWVAYGAKGYGRQLWVPSGFGGVFKATVYYCIVSNCSSHQTVDVIGPNTSRQAKIANLARLNLGQTGCTAPYFIINHVNSCSGTPDGTAAWCGVFAGWVWSTSGVTTLDGLNGAPSTYDAYGTRHSSKHSDPRAGDVVVFDYSTPTGSGMGHVAIVYWVDWNAASGGLVTAIGGNERDTNDPSDVVGAARTFAMWPGSTSILNGSDTYTVDEYVSPV